MDQTKDEEVINDKDLDHPRRPKQKAKPKEIILAIFLVITVAISASLSAVLLTYAYYYETFYVNGQSMYPTLNKDAEQYLGNGKYRAGKDISWGYHNGDRNVDLGIMDCHKFAINRIKRFDIVILKYDNDDNTKYIKRVIGLPNEQLYFQVDSSRDLNTSQNGRLWVKKKGESNFDCIEQPINKEMVINGSYPNYNSKESAISLKDNEIFVVGDNRPKEHSSDSRTIGPRSINLVIGVAVAIIAKCELKVNSKNELESVNEHYHWPRYI